ncbi:Tetratricopeptide repeat protein 17 [Frankliniella fusca]|uniref:Tetratricopeptide repeat protein 17 n=1 Tax=Frankliniella fusca TaxID=407009 RepID=A0AAE1HW97_9NEOP|nr:Tetratricopeptide repeat protein 17 [Frankliniella fusca]
MSDVPCITYMALYILSLHVIQSNSRASTGWRLDPEEGKIVQTTIYPNAFGPQSTEDLIFDIISSTVHVGNTWTKTAAGSLCKECHLTNNSEIGLNNVSNRNNNATNSTTSSHSSSPSGNNKRRCNGTVTGGSKPQLTAPDGTIVKVKESKSKSGDSEQLDCGKPVNFTYYDNLLGISNRQSHPHVPELQMELIFRKKVVKDQDVENLERKLKKAKRDKPKSVKLYNQIGNFWRIKGDTQKSIECFRRALAVSPDNAEVLLNLARVMLNLQYWDDALKLTVWSLDKTDKNAWQQHFTLGEIFKAVAVLLVILVGCSSDSSDVGDSDTKAQRHFNKPLSMRSLKLGISSRGFRSKGSSKNTSHN